jgi:hypothetical protein
VPVGWLEALRPHYQQLRATTWHSTCALLGHELCVGFPAKSCGVSAHSSPWMRAICHTLRRFRDKRRRLMTILGMKRLEKSHFVHMELFPWTQHSILIVAVAGMLIH